MSESEQSRIEQSIIEQSPFAAIEMAAMEAEKRGVNSAFTARKEVAVTNEETDENEEVADQKSEVHPNAPLPPDNHQDLIPEIKQRTGEYIELHGDRIKKRPHDIDAGESRNRPPGKNIKREQIHLLKLVEEGFDDYQNEKESIINDALDNQPLQAIEDAYSWLEDLLQDLEKEPRINGTQTELINTIRRKIDNLNKEKSKLLQSNEVDDVAYEENEVDDETYEGKVNRTRLFIQDLSRSLSIGEKRDFSKIEEFRGITDKLDRLRALTNMNIADAVEAVLETENAGSNYLLKKLKFYDDLIQGRATRRVKEYDYEKGKYVYSDKTTIIDNSDVTPQTVANGLLRDIVYAEMIGTPELSALRIAKRRIQDQNDKKNSSNFGGLSTSHLPELFGYNSDIQYGKQGIGNYPLLRKIYNQAAVLASKEAHTELSPEGIEHAAVIMAAEWYSKGAEYNLSGKGPASPYVASLDETIAWTKLGESVRNQLRGMRQKIQGIDLHNIGRFEGVSGDGGRSGRERRSLRYELKNLHEVSIGEQEESVRKRNADDITRATNDYQIQSVRLNNLLLKRRERIYALDLPEEEKRLQLESIEEQHQNALNEVNHTYHTRIEQLNNRNYDQLILELQEKLEKVEIQYQKRKSLAAKAIDLYFRFGHKKDERGHWMESNLNFIDWINDVPLGTIKRAHSALQKGVSEETAIAMATTEMIFGQQNITREKLESIQQLMSEKNSYQLKILVQIGNLLSQMEIKLPFETIQLIAERYHNPEVLREVLKNFQVEEITELVNSDVDLSLAKNVREWLHEHGISDLTDVNSIILITKLPGGSEAVLQSLHAGFKLDEIAQLPFLASSLTQTLPGVDPLKNFNLYSR